MSNKPGTKAERRARRAQKTAAAAGTEDERGRGGLSEDAAVRAEIFESAEHTPYLGVSTEVGQFLIATKDGGVGRSLFVNGVRPEFRVLQRAVGVIEDAIGPETVAGRSFIDVGAKIGTKTVCALIAHGFGSAVCCEPERANHQLLRANLALNDLDERADALQVSVTDQAGPGSSLIRQNRPSASSVVPGGPVVTLDQLTHEGVIDLDRAGLVWIDAEGHEGQVLEGARAVVGRGVPIVFEFHPAVMEAADRETLHRTAEEFYTHFVDVRRRSRRGQPRLRLRTIAELDDRTELLLSSSPAAAPSTDLLLLRCEPP